MIGIDTSFLVAYEVKSHTKHQPAREFAKNRYEESFALAPQVLAEFIHVVTDPKRFEYPIMMKKALETAEKWLHAREVRIFAAGQDASALCIRFLHELDLGRNRILDTLLASTYIEAGVHSVVTADKRGFARFGGLAPIVI